MSNNEQPEVYLAFTRLNFQHFENSDLAFIIDELAYLFKEANLDSNFLHTLRCNVPHCVVITLHWPADPLIANVAREFLKHNKSSTELLLRRVIPEIFMYVGEDDH